MKLIHSSLMLVCGVGLVAACSTPSSPVVEGSPSDSDVDTSELSRTTGALWRGTTHARLGTVAHLEGKSAPLLAGTTAFAATVRFLAENQKLFGMRAPTSEFVEARVRTDALAMTHVRLQQVSHGLPVMGAELSAHFAADGSLLVVDANYVSGLDSLSVNPSLDADAAIERTNADFAARFSSATSEHTTPELVIFVPALAQNEGTAAGAARLAYHLEVHDYEGETPARLDYTVDAHTGQVINVIDNLQTAAAQGSSSKGKTFAFEAAQQGGSYVMSDIVRVPTGIRTYSARNGQGLPGTLVSSPTLNGGWDTNAPSKPGAAVDAHYFASKVYDFYKTKLARKGIDGNDGAMISTSHYGNNFANAFWNGTQMAYGDGNAQTNAFTAALDVVGHEFTHGVTNRESNLTYQNQSGALNEAMSDIFGNVIEHEVLPDPTKNWIVGEELGGVGFIRDMVDPSKGRQPGHMLEYVRTSQDNGGVHINSGIVNNAAYLMTMGGTQVRSKIKVDRGIGWENLAKVFYRANTEYLMQSSDFRAAATATARAATDLKLSDNDQKIIDCAWKAVGVLPGACQPLAPEAPKPEPTADGGATPPPPAPPSSSARPAGAQPAVEESAAPEASGCAVGATVGVTNDTEAARALFVAALVLLVLRRRRHSADASA